MTTVPGFSLITRPTSDAVLYVANDLGGTPVDASIEPTALLEREHGSIYTGAGAGSQAILSATGFDKVDQFDTDGDADRTTPTASSNLLTLDNAGRYQVAFHITFLGDALTLFEFGVYWAGVLQSQIQADIEGGGSGRRSCSAAGIVNVSSGTTDLELYCKVSVDATLQVKKAGLSAVRFY